MTEPCLKASSLSHRTYVYLCKETPVPSMLKPRNSSAWRFARQAAASLSQQVNSIQLTSTKMGTPNFLKSSGTMSNSQRTHLVTTSNGQINETCSTTAEWTPPRKCFIIQMQSGYISVHLCVCIYIHIYISIYLGYPGF